MSWTNAVILMMWALAANPLSSNIKGQPTPTPDQEPPVVVLSGPVHQTFVTSINLPGQADLVVPNQPPIQIKEIPSSQRPEVVHLPGSWATGPGVEIDIAPRFWNKRRHVWPNPFYKYDRLENGAIRLPEPPPGDFQPQSLPGKTTQQDVVQGLCVEPDMASLE